MRRYRAPRGDGEILADPTLAEAERLIATQAAALAASPMAEAAAAARRELLETAIHYTGGYRDVSFATGSSPPTEIVMAGHQPVLFHPGVWLKNFALSRLAARPGRVGINFLADGDAIRTAAIRVPAGSLADPRIESIAFDATGPEVPHEERSILRADLLHSFAARVNRAVGELVPNPMLEDYWPRVLGAASRTDRLGLAIAQGRHELEAAWGLRTLEVPLSALCRGPAFLRFAATILADAGRFGEVYNSAVTDYRHHYKIRSRAHPVPELERADGWQEAPFWLWTADTPRRRRAFVRQTAGEWELSDRDRLSLPLGRAGDPDSLAAALAGLPADVRLRPRALATTLFARLLLSDLFIHGIGGGMYDQVTDAILRRFFEVEPPAYLVLTGTYRLPLARSATTPEDLARIDRTLRELTYDPGKHIDPSDSRAATLAAERAAWVANELPKGQRRERHVALRRLDDALQPLVAERRRELAFERQRVAEELRRSQVLASREFAFCLFPEDFLRKQLLDFARSQR
jgi:hypothetical protein